MIYMNKPRFVYRVQFDEIDLLSFSMRIYHSIDRCFTSRRNALSFYRDLIRYSDFSGSRPCISLCSEGSLSCGFIANNSLFVFRFIQSLVG